MAVTWRLKRPKQCATCPWRVDTSVKDIPDYQPDQHKSLAGTIADPEAPSFNRELRVMTCHYSTDTGKLKCIGWVENQINNNNITLRLRMRQCENLSELETIGPQVKTFEDTFK